MLTTRRQGHGWRDTKRRDGRHMLHMDAHGDNCGSDHGDADGNNYDENRAGTMHLTLLVQELAEGKVQSRGLPVHIVFEEQESFLPY